MYSIRLVYGENFRKPPYLMGQSMVSGFDFPFNQCKEFSGVKVLMSTYSCVPTKVHLVSGDKRQRRTVVLSGLVSLLLEGVSASKSMSTHVCIYIYIHIIFCRIFQTNFAPSSTRMTNGTRLASWTSMVSNACNATWNKMCVKDLVYNVYIVIRRHMCVIYIYIYIHIHVYA